MPVSADEPRRVRQDEADEADRSGDAHEDRRDERREQEETEAHLGRVDAERGRDLVTEGERVEHLRRAPRDRHADEHGDGAQHRVRPANPLERAEQPEHHPARLVGVGEREDDEGGERREELGARDTGEHDLLGAAAGESREDEDEREGEDRSEEGAARQAQAGPADAEDPDDDRARRGPGGDAEDEGIGERVAQQ